MTTITIPTQEATETAVAAAVRRWWELGLFWLALTLTFEIGLGRATGMAWDRLASDFDPRRGGLLGFGMLVILVTPRILAERRGLVLCGDDTA